MEDRTRPKRKPQTHALAFKFGVSQKLRPRNFRPQTSKTQTSKLQTSKTQTSKLQTP